MNVTGGSTDVSTYFVLRLAATGIGATGLTITDMDLQYVRTGAAPSAKVDATALAATDSAHADNKAIEVDATDAPGLYRVDWPDAAFAAGARQAILTVKVATCFTEHMAVDIDPPVDVTRISGDSTAADNLESYCDGTTPIPANATQISGDATAADNLEAAHDGTGYAGGTIKPKVDLETIKTQAVTCAAGVTVLASVGTAATSTAQTGDSYALANGASGFAAIKGETAAILADTGTDGVVVAAGSKTGYALSAAGIQAVWDALTSALTTAGSIGKRLADYVDAAISGRSSHAAADVWAVGTRALTDKAGFTLHADYNAAKTAAQAGDQMNLANDAITAAKFDESTAFPLAAADTGSTAVARTGADADTLETLSDQIDASATPPSAASIADAVWDEALSGHAGAGSTGEALAGASAPSAAAVADAVWDEAISGHLGAGSTGAALNAAGSSGDPWATPLPGAYGSGTAGKIIGDNINTTVGSRASQTSVDTVDGIVDSILEDTAQIGTAGAGLTALGDTRLANLDAAVSTRSTLAAGAAMTLTSAYDAAKTAAQAGNQMDLVNAPNSTAVTAIQNGLATAVGVGAVETDTQDIQSRLPAALESGRMAAALAATPPTAADIKTAVEADGSKLDAIYDKLPAGSIGDATATNQSTIAGYLDTEIAAILAAVDTEIADIQSRLPAALSGGRIPAVLESTPPGVAAIADGVLDELLSGHTIVGSAGAALTAASAGTGGGFDEDDRADLQAAKQYALSAMSAAQQAG